MAERASKRSRSKNLLCGLSVNGRQCCVRSNLDWPRAWEQINKSIVFTPLWASDFLKVNIEIVTDLTGHFVRMGTMRSTMSTSLKVPKVCAQWLADQVQHWGFKATELEKCQSQCQSPYGRREIQISRDGSYGVGVLYVVSYLSRIYPYFSNCFV